MECSVCEDCVKGHKRRQRLLVKLSHFFEESSLKSAKMLAISTDVFH